MKLATQDTVHKKCASARSCAHSATEKLAFLHLDSGHLIDSKRAAERRAVVEAKWATFVPADVEELFAFLCCARAPQP